MKKIFNIRFAIYFIISAFVLLGPNSYTQMSWEQIIGYTIASFIIAFIGSALINYIKNRKKGN